MPTIYGFRGEHVIFGKEPNDMLRQQRKLRSMIKHQHDSLTRCLSLEVISIIFRFYVAEDFQDDPQVWLSDTHLSPLVLGAVCQSWRSIAWSSLHIWTHIRINVNVQRQDSWIYRDVAEEWLSRSSQLPLSIYFKIDYDATHNWDDRYAPEVGAQEEALLALISVLNGIPVAGGI